MKSHLLPTVTLIFFLLGITPLFRGHSQGSMAKNNNNFSFVFLTDIHITTERDAGPGFRQAIATINALKPDFVITGGDLIMDALEQRYSKADSLYKLYEAAIGAFAMPVYNTMGNHEIYGIYKKSGADPKHPEYGEKMFEKRLGKSYYAFNYKGWKFMILNSVEDSRRGGYIGMIDSVQVEWIKDELSKTDTNTPIVISTHIPFLTVYHQKYYGSTRASDSASVVVNSKEVIGCFKKHNLKLVLQGHMHTVEDIYIDGTHFITGGAVSAGWWKGPHFGHQEGFMLLQVDGEQFTWKYVDYGWEPKSKRK